MQTGQIFEGDRGYWRYRGKPFFVTTAHAICHHYRSAADPEKILDSLGDLKRAGFTAVEVYARYPLVRVTDRGYDWEMFDAFVERAAGEGLKIFVCLLYDLVPSRTKIPEKDYIKLATSWYRKNGFLWMDEEGKSHATPSHGNHTCGALPCHPDFMRKAETHTKAVARHVVDHEAVIYWLLMGEFELFGRRGQLGYDEFSRKRFRAWMRSRYSLKELSTRWGRRYRRWEEVEPPKLSIPTDFQGRRLPNAQISRWDLYQFQQAISRFFWSESIRWIKAIDKRPIGCEENQAMNGYFTIHDRAVNSGYMLDYGQICNFENDYQYGRFLYFISMAKSYGPPPYQNNESQANCSIEHARRQAYLIQAMGGTGLNVWEWGGTRELWNPWEGNYYALLDGDNEREALSEHIRLNREFEAIAPVLVPTWAQPNRISLFCPREVGYWNQTRENITYVPYPTKAKEKLCEFSDYLIHAGLGGEVCSMHDAHEFETSSLVIAPLVNYVSTDIVDRLCRYVKNGGTLILGAHSGEFNEIAETQRKNKLAALTGLRLEKRALIADQLTTAATMPRLERGERIDLRHLTNPRVQKAEVKESGVKVLAKFGDTPVLTVRKVGNGQCVFWGLEPTRGLIPTCRQSEIYDLTASLFEYLGFSPHVTVRNNLGHDYDIITGVKNHADGAILFVIETGDYKRSITVELNPERFNLDDDYYVHEILGSKSYPLKLRNSKIRSAISSAEVQIYFVTKDPKPPCRTRKTAADGRYRKREFVLLDKISTDKFQRVNLKGAARRQSDRRRMQVTGMRSDDFMHGQWLEISLPKAKFIETLGVQFELLSDEMLKYVVAEKAGDNIEIPVGAKGQKLHILGNSAWAAATNTNENALIGEYVIEYADRKKQNYPLRLYREVDYFRFFMGHHLAQNVMPALQVQLEGHMDLFSVPLRKVKVSRIIYRQIHTKVFPLTFAITVEKL